MAIRLLLHALLCGGLLATTAGAHSTPHDAPPIPIESAVWWTDTTVPVDSPLWWTLDPAFSSEALRTEWASSRPLRNGRDHPEWIPWWLAWEHAVDHLRTDPASIRTVLASASVSAPGIDRIVEAATSTVRDRANRLAEIRPHLDELSEVLRAGARNLGKRRFHRAWDRQDWSTIAEATGRPADHIETLVAAGRRNPSVEASVIGSARLRRAITPDDWDRLTRYLKQHIAPTLSIGSAPPPSPEPIDRRVFGVAALIALLIALVVQRRLAAPEPLPFYG